MDKIDSILGMDWSEARYIGDGVYVMEAEDRQGIPAVALRTDRSENGSNVIVLESEYFEELVKVGQALIAYQFNRRRLKEAEG